MKIFIISLVALVILVVLYVRKQKKSQQEHVYNYYRDKKIMNELTFPAFRYYVEDDCMKGNKHFQEISGRRSIEDFLKSAEKWKNLHPEYNFDGLFSEIDRVKKNRQMTTFESVLQLEDKKSYWFKTILIPISGKTGGELIILGMVMDTTQEHKYYEETVAIMGNAPIGLFIVYESV